MLEFEAVPHNWIPYVEIGYSTVLFSSNLLSIDTADSLSSKQYILLNFELSCFLFSFCFEVFTPSEPSI
jgi:hypothetical protein